MTPERFEDLAEAWGGDIARWPDAERVAAALVMAARPDWAQAVLARAGDLDAVLDMFAPPAGAPALTAQIVASAPSPRARRWISWLLPAGMGAGLAAACAAGVLAGAHLQPASSTPATSEADALVTAVGDEDFGLLLGEDA